MKKNDIKKAVSKATAKELPRAIKDEARYRANEMVRKALAPPIDSMKMPEEATERDAGVAPTNRVFAPDDPKLCGY